MPVPSTKPPRRRRVVLAESRGRGGSARARTIVELEEQTSVGEKLVRDLIKQQLRTALGLAGLVLLLLGWMPVTFYLVPALSEVRVLGAPLPWLLMGLVPFPLLYAAGYWYRRKAEYHERDFVNMVDR
jgi:hypothetical protein